jgi:hypothetical protein
MGDGVDLEPHPLDEKTAKAAARLFNSVELSSTLSVR